MSVFACWYFLCSAWLLAYPLLILTFCSCHCLSMVFFFLMCGYFFLPSALASSSRWCCLFESTVCSHQRYPAGSTHSQAQRMVLGNTPEPGVSCKSLLDTLLSVTSRCVSGAWGCNSVSPPVTQVSCRTSFQYRTWFTAKGTFTSSGLIPSPSLSRLLCSWTLFSVQLYTATYTYA